MWWDWGDDSPSPVASIGPEPIRDHETICWFNFHDRPTPGFDAHPALHIALNEADLPEPASWSSVDVVLQRYIEWTERAIDLHFAPLFAEVE